MVYTMEASKGTYRVTESGKGLGTRQPSLDELELDDVNGRIVEILHSVDIPIVKVAKLKSEEVPLNPKKEGSLLMLLYGLQKFKPEICIATAFKERQLWSLIATSGMGKTHTALSYLSSNFGFYLSCAKPSDTNFGSSDMSYFLERLAVDGRVTKDHEANLKYVKIFMKCVMLARLKVFSQLQAKYPNLTSEQWLYFQLFPPVLTKSSNSNLLLEKYDIFSQVTVLLRSLSEKNLDKLVSALSLDSPKIPVFLDEAQILCLLYGNSFMFSKERPLYSAVCKGIVDSLINENISVCAIGTGLALGVMDELNSSNSFKDFDARSHVNQRICLTYSSEQVHAYLEKFITIPEELAYICSWLVGRPRIASSFLQFIYENGGLSKKTCNDYVKFQTTPGPQRSIYMDMNSLFLGKRSLIDEGLIKKLSNELKLAVRDYMYTGAIYMTSNVSMFEFGFGILSRKVYESRDEMISIFEPIVFKAAYNYFYGDSSDSAIEREPLNVMSLLKLMPSALGFVFELTVPMVVKKLLQMNEETRKNVFNDKGWRSESLQLKQSKEILSRPFIKNETHEYPLEYHLQNPQCDLLSVDQNKGADFASSVENMYGEPFGVVSVQAKFRNNFNQDDALEKTAILKFNPNGVYIRILLAYPKKTKFVLMTRRRNMYILIIDQRNANHFFSEYELAAFDYFKSTCNMENWSNLDMTCQGLEIDSIDE